MKNCIRWFLFQIFLNGAYKYWVHSATRTVALLHPVNLNSELEISVCPIDSKGDIILRSSTIYMP